MELFDDIKKIIVIPAINEHKDSLDSENPRDFMDVYLSQVESTKDQNSSFHGKRGEESLIASLIDLFLAGKYIYKVYNSNQFGKHYSLKNFLRIQLEDNNNF